MAERAAFQDLQMRMAAHVRDPENNPAPEGIEDRRLGIYRDLFFNNVASLLAGTFPVLHEILGDQRWRTLMRDYFARHRAHTPYFLEMPGEFLAYLETERGEVAEDPKFLLELAHYEWVELAVAVAEDEIQMQGIAAEGDLLSGIPVVSPLARVLCYHYPVHRISQEYQPVSAPGEATWLAVCRDADDRVGFTEINQVTARLIELARAEDKTGREVLEQIARELGSPDAHAVIEGGRATMNLLRERAIILGTRIPG